MAGKEESQTSPTRAAFVRPPEPRLFDQATAAAYLGLSERTFEAQWRSYKIPYPHKIGRRLLWDRRILDAWADTLPGFENKPLQVQVVESSPPSSNLAKR